MRSILPITALLGAFATQAAAESSFRTPGGSGSTGWRNNPSYEVDESINVEWETDLRETNLLLWQDHPGAGGGTQFFVQLKGSWEDYGFPLMTWTYRASLENSTSTSFIWQVNFGGFSTEVADNEDAVFHFALFESGTNNQVALSGAFNVTVPRDETTTSTQSTTVEPSSATNPASTAAAATTDSAAETTGADAGNNSGGDELSTGAVAGIAVGATLGGLLVLGGAGFLLWKHFRKGSGATAGGYAPPGELGPGGQGQPVQEYYKPPGQQGPQAELADQQWMHPPQQGYARGPGGLHEAP
ncbi:hypothetical protein F66182_2501 [Fusarium sp. NRRL 66182]|nr:hypothetical protein F66182_2501 [Fusarium sp. NRRL 66182]